MKQLIKKLLVFILTIPTVNAVIGCNIKDENYILVGLPHRSDEFNTIIGNTIASHAKKNGYKTIETVAQLPTGSEDVQKQLENVNIGIIKGVKGMVLLPVNKESSIIPIRKANEARIPVVILDRGTNCQVGDVPEDYVISSNTCYVAGNVATSNEEGGYRVAQIIAEKLGYVVKTKTWAPNKEPSSPYRSYELYGEIGTDSAELRGKGIRRFIQEHPSVFAPIDEKDKVHANWQQEKAKDLIRTKFMTETRRVIFSHNDNMAQGAADALEKDLQWKPTDERYPIINGYDNERSIKEYILAGKVAFTLAQQVVEMSKYVIDLLIKIIQGELVQRLKSDETDKQFKPILYRKEDFLNK